MQMEERGVIMVDFEATYNLTIKTVQELVEDVRFGRNCNMEAVKTCAGEICKYLDSNNNILNILNEVKDKNPYMYSHPVNVAFVSYVIGKWMHLNGTELYQLACAGILHDIGKAKIRDSILNRSTKLSDQEMETVRTHPSVGFAILSELDVFEPEVLLGVLSHHERQDGTGYPEGLKGNNISLYGRIIAIADTYDAMTSTKPYNTKRSPFKVVEEIVASSFGAFDPQICQIFLQHMINYYPGSFVRLNNDRVGEIIYINPEEQTRPLIRCGEEYFDMALDRDLEIVEMLPEIG